MARRGTVGSFVRLAKQMERQSRTQQRELLRRQKAASRLEAYERGLLNIELFENHIARITTIHTEASERIHWPDLTEPRVDRSGSVAAQRAIDEFKPGFFTRLFGEEGARRKLAEKLEARLNDERLALEEAHRIAALARAVLSGSEEGYLHAITETGCLSELVELGAAPVGHIVSPTLAECTVHAEEQGVVPLAEPTMTKTGKPSSKKIPKRRRHELYEDYVCGLAIRAARELLTVLPLEKVLVHVRATIFNSATGNDEDVCVLSVWLPRARAETVNFDRADPSDLVESLQHRIERKRGDGLRAVQPLSASGEETIEFSSC